MSADAQLVFDLPHRTARGRENYLVSSSNALAVEVVEAWETWPGHRLLLTGPARSGKTHLALVWAEMSGARVLSVTDLTAGVVIPSQPLVIEDLDRLSGLDAAQKAEAEEALFHLFNRFGADRIPLLFTGSDKPKAWHLGLPDLRSRIEAMTLAEIGQPDDMLLSSVVVKLFSDRQLRVEPKVIDYVVNRMERSFEAAEALVDRLDTASLRAKKRVTTTLVRTHAGWQDDED